MINIEKRQIYAVDFDGTICVHNFPSIGKPMPMAFEVMKEMQEHGHKLILWTCREGKHLEEAIEFCKNNGVEFVSHNTNTKEDAYMWPPSRKILADLYIDDRNIGGFIGWEKVREIVFGKK